MQWTASSVLAASVPHLSRFRRRRHPLRLRGSTTGHRAGLRGSPYERERAPDRRAGLGRLHSHVAADEPGTLAHADQAEALDALCGVESMAVVGDLHLDGFRAGGQPDAHVFGPRVSGGVGQRFLDEAIDGRLDLWIEALRTEVEFPGDIEALARAQAREQAFERRLQTEMVERGG